MEDAEKNEQLEAENDAQLENASSSEVGFASENAVEPQNVETSTTEDENTNCEAKAEESKTADNAEPVTSAEELLKEQKNTSQWYILKVQVNREDHVMKELMNRVKSANLSEYVEKILVPTKISIENKNGRVRKLKQKLYPGYIMIKMVLNDPVWFLLREAPGIGDFAGAVGRLRTGEDGYEEVRPLPMSDVDVERILATEAEGDEDKAKIEINFKVGDKVKITEGSFIDMVGTVGTLESDGKLTVDIGVLGGITSVDKEYWQVEKVEVD